MTNEAPSKPEERGEAAPESASGARWILGLALLVGLARFWKLGAWSLWFDEAATWTDWFVGIESGEIQNPLGYRLVHATVGLLGGRPDEFALRFLPAVAGFLAIPATAWAFRPIASRRTAAIAALLVAASSWQVYWSQNARFYTLTELATLLGAGVWLRAFLGGSALRALLGLAITGAGAFFHPSAALLVPALLVAPGVALLRARFVLGPRKRLLLFLWGGALIAALFAIPWARATLSTYFLQKGSAGPFANPVQTLERLGHLAKTTGFYFTPYLGAAALVGLVLAWRKRELGG
ncbi:MAG: glycosyltransferase family 39 protein, partial [Planctomycetes bacterium]|nr:glycosyltransferase family 39 protein [Planctomycetota bacterium]